MVGPLHYSTGSGPLEELPWWIAMAHGQSKLYKALAHSSAKPAKNQPNPYPTMAGQNMPGPWPTKIMSNSGHDRHLAKRANDRSLPSRAHDRPLISPEHCWPIHNTAHALPSK
jgi:hypothetical protein